MLGWTLRETKQGGLQLLCPPEMNRGYLVGAIACAVLAVVCGFVSSLNIVNGRMEGVSAYGCIGFLASLVGFLMCLGSLVQPTLELRRSLYGTRMALYKRPNRTYTSVANVVRLEIRQELDDWALVAITNGGKQTLWIAPGDQLCRYVAEEFAAAMNRPLV